MDLNCSDIERILPTCKIVRNENNVEVINKRQNTEGFLETNVELIDLYKDITTRNIQYNTDKNIRHSICLTIEDVKNSYQDRDCWKFHNLSYRNVLVYGNIVILNIKTTLDRTYYTISIDDETDCIEGYVNKTPDSVSSKCELKQGRSKLERRKETGINLGGKFYKSDSDECKEILNNVKSLQLMIEKNLKSTERNFLLGPLEEKALVYGRPILRNDTIRLNVFEMKLCDDLELTWKRNINKLYSKSYFN